MAGEQGFGVNWPNFPHQNLIRPHVHLSPTAVGRADQSIHDKFLVSLGEAHHIVFCLLTLAPFAISAAAFLFYWAEFFLFLLEEDLRFGHHAP